MRFVPLHDLLVDGVIGQILIKSLDIIVNFNNDRAYGVIGGLEQVQS